MDILALLFPREKKFYRMLEEQVKLVGTSIDDFYALIDRYDKSSKLQKNRLISQISKKEMQDDVLYTKMVQALKSTFITPMDREDIHKLVGTFDTIIDTLELLTLKLSAFRIKKINKHFKEQAFLLQKSFRLAEKMIFEIRNEKQAEKYCRQVRTLESEADAVYIKAVGNLFADSVKPAEIIKYQDLYTSMEKMIDVVNEAVLLIENIVVKYS